MLCYWFLSRFACRWRCVSHHCQLAIVTCHGMFLKKLELELIARNVNEKMNFEAQTFLVCWKAYRHNGCLLCVFLCVCRGLVVRVRALVCDKLFFSDNFACTSRYWFKSLERLLLVGDLIVHIKSSWFYVHNKIGRSPRSDRKNVLFFRLGQLLCFQARLGHMSRFFSVWSYM